MILIISDAFDSHANTVELHLKKFGAAFFRLNLDVESLKNTSLSFVDLNWKIKYNSKVADAKNITCIWARRLTVSLDLEQQHSDIDPGFRIWRGEWNRSLYGLYSSLRERFWMNPIAQSSLIDNKFYQLTLATAEGFSVPEFISSNDKTILQDFARRHGEVALKFMAQETYQIGDSEFRGIYVNKLTNSDLESFSTVGENPVVLQRYIDKKYEIRYTYVDGSHFACKIESQNSKISNIDWRRYDIANTPHTLVMAPRSIMLKIEKMMKSIGLYYGAFDFIVDKSDNWWYLEVNTAGQWLWIEDLAGAEISLKIAERLHLRSQGAN